MVNMCFWCGKPANFKDALKVSPLRNQGIDCPQCGFYEMTFEAKTALLDNQKMTDAEKEKVAAYLKGVTREVGKPESLTIQKISEIVGVDLLRRDR